MRDSSGNKMGPSMVIVYTGPQIAYSRSAKLISRIVIEYRNSSIQMQSRMTARTAWMRTARGWRMKRPMTRRTVMKWKRKMRDDKILISPKFLSGIYFVLTRTKKDFKRLNVS